MFKQAGLAMWWWWWVIHVTAQVVTPAAHRRGRQGAAACWAGYRRGDLLGQADLHATAILYPPWQSTHTIRHTPPGCSAPAPELPPTRR